MQTVKSGILDTFTLFASFSTLICCALPALLVTLGAGAALAGTVSAVPQLIWLSEYKIALFTGAGILLAASGALRYYNRNAPCPVDPAQAQACTRLRALSKKLYVTSCAIYATGFFFAFVAPFIII